MKMEVGMCPACDKEIADACVSCGTKKVNQKYTEVLMKLSTGSKMVMACCNDCAATNNIYKVDKNELMKNVKLRWLYELRNSPQEVIDHHKENIKDLHFVD